jgi:5-methylcytosine-specific restriction endonuclease McrA
MSAGWVRRTPRRQTGGTGWGRQKLRVLVFLRDGGHCLWCGTALTLEPGARQMVMDHLRAVASGGSDDEDNLVSSCRACNERRRREQAVAGRRKRPSKLREPEPHPGLLTGRTDFFGAAGLRPASGAVGAVSTEVRL